MNYAHGPRLLQCSHEVNLGHLGHPRVQVEGNHLQRFEQHERPAGGPPHGVGDDLDLLLLEDAALLFHLSLVAPVAHKRLEVEQTRLEELVALCLHKILDELVR